MEATAELIDDHGISIVISIIFIIAAYKGIVLFFFYSDKMAALSVTKRANEIRNEDIKDKKLAELLDAMTTSLAVITGSSTNINSRIEDTKKLIKNIETNIKELQLEFAGLKSNELSELYKAFDELKTVVTDSIATQSDAQATSIDLDRDRSPKLEGGGLGSF